FLPAMAASQHCARNVCFRWPFRAARRTSRSVTPRRQTPASSGSRSSQGTGPLPPTIFIEFAGSIVGGTQRRFVQLIGVVTVLGLAAGSPGAGGAREGLPLVGANYSHFGVCGCDAVYGEGIVANGMVNRSLIRRQLAAMRAAGIQSLRLFIWSMHDATGQTWGVVSSAGGRLGAVEEK